MKTNLDESLVSIFKSSAKKYRKIFSYLQRNIVVTGNRDIYIPPAVAKELSDKTSPLSKMLVKERAGFNESGMVAVAQLMTKGKYNKNLDYSIRSNFAIVTMLNDFMSYSKIKSIFIADHEFGHQILTHTEDYKINKKQGESIADSFAYLMQFKRFGYNRPINDKYSFITASYLYDGDGNHCSVPALQVCRSLSEQVNISKLPIKDIGWYAKEIGSKFYINDTKADKIKRALFSDPVSWSRDYNKSSENVHTLCWEHKDDADIFRYGTHFIISNLYDGLLETNKEEWVKKIDAMWEHQRKNFGGYVQTTDGKHNEAVIKELIARKARSDKKHRHFNQAMK